MGILEGFEWFKKLGGDQQVEKVGGGMKFLIVRVFMWETDV